MKQLIHTLNALKNQDLNGIQLEVIIGTYASEVDEKEILQLFDSLNIRFARYKGNNWVTSKARNCAIESACGEIIILLDSDIYLNSNAISNHLSWHLSNNEKLKILLGEVNGYNKLDDSIDMDHLLSNKDLVPDRRCKLDVTKSAIPWSLSWTGNLSFSKNDFKTANEYFDENFMGWGMEDQEWAYRLHAKGFTFYFNKSISGIHLPHNRDVKKNLEEEEVNLKIFLSKHPSFGVELVSIFGDTYANQIYSDLNEKIQNLPQYIPKFKDNKDINFVNRIYFGIPRSGIIRKSTLLNTSNVNMPIIENEDIKIFRLLGLKTPFLNKYFSESYISKSLGILGNEYFDLIKKEAHRVADKVRLIE